MRVRASEKGVLWGLGVWERSPNQPVAAFDLTEAAEKRFEDMAPKKGGKDKKECVHRTSLPLPRASAYPIAMPRRSRCLPLVLPRAPPTPLCNPSSDISEQ